MVTALYPGSFDPVTMGHLDVAKRAARLFERLIIAVYDTPSKSLLFNTEERVGLIREAAADIDNIEVRPFTGLVVKTARDVGAATIIRGLRSGPDFEYECQMFFMNRPAGTRCGHGFADERPGPHLHQLQPAQGSCPVGRRHCRNGAAQRRSRFG